MMFLLASILLEPNRWKPGRPPSILASEWSDRARSAGFDGWELFENHYRMANEREQRAIESGPLPVRIFNTYERLHEAESPAWRDVVAQAVRLGAKGLKFNMGPDRTDWPTERRAVKAVASLSRNVRLLCECHPGTSLETPEAVLDFMREEDKWPFDLIIHPFLLAPEAIAHWGRVLPGRVVHAHVQMRADADNQSFVSLAVNAGRARECLAALAATGFSGSFSLEFAAPTNRTDETPETLFVSAMRDLVFLRENWKPSCSFDSTPPSIRQAAPPWI